MDCCKEYNLDILLYLNNELCSPKLEEFYTHLEICADCRKQLEEEQTLSLILHRSRPLYLAPETLRARVSANAPWQASRPIDAPDNALRRVLRTLTEPLRWLPQPARHWKALLAAGLVFILCLIFVPDLAQQARATAYVETAVATHRGYLNGALPLEIRSGSPAVVTAWIAAKVPFRFRLPAFQEASNVEPAYRLTGARLVNFKNGYAALLAYEMQKEKISLLVTSREWTVAAGGTVVRFGGLVFHDRSSGDFRVVTWTSHGLTYALVSSLPVSGQHSCLVCHQNMADHAVFQ
jgi:anti-sigma factor RsiW